MPREKQGYRQMLEYLIEKGTPMTSTRQQAAKTLGVSKPVLDALIRRGVIKCVCDGIPIGSIASYLCG